MNLRTSARRTPLLAPLVAALLAAAAASSSQAQALPGAGTILQQVQQPPPPPPTRSPEALKLESPAESALPPSTPFEVRALRITGNTRIDTATLHALVADAEGRTLMLADLGELAHRITRYYRSRGYPLARAIIPPQTIAAGEVTIQVIEARYGRVALDNTARVRPSLLQATLAGLQPGEQIEQAGLDRALLLLSDIPGLLVSATLRPAATVGGADLQVAATPTAAVLGEATADSFGSRYTGRVRLGASVSLVNPLQRGDVLSAHVLASGSGMDYGRLGYELLLNGQGTRVGASLSALRYALGDAQAALGAHGTAQVGELTVSQPFLRGRDLNLAGRLALESTRLSDHIDASDIRADRRMQGLTLALAGDAGPATASLSWQAGRVRFDDDAAQQADAATVNTQGGFSKWNAGVTSLLPLGAGRLFLALAGQAASRNLDPSAKMGAGGPNAVRAYEAGTLSGDEGWLATAEYRQGLAALGGGQLWGMVFADVAHLTINHQPWSAAPNRAVLSGAGLGLQWVQNGPWAARAFVASPLGARPAQLGGSRPARVGAELRFAF